MPLCMSPESYRAEITRRKSAERERDDLAKQAERLIEENEKLTANVATLVEQIGEAKQQAALYRADREGVYRDFERAMDERDDARRDRDRLLDELDADSMAGLARARGAAHPVVEPRDERPGFEGGDLETLLRVVTCAVAYRRTTTTRAGMMLPDALSDDEVRDAEGLLATMRRHLAGYAPH